MKRILYTLFLICSFLFSGCKEKLQQHKKFVFYKTVSFENQLKLEEFLRQFEHTIGEYGYVKDEREKFDSIVSFTPSSPSSHRLFVKRIGIDWGAFLVLFNPSGPREIRIIFHHSVFTEGGKGLEHKQLYFEIDEENLRKRLPLLKISDVN